MIKWRAFGNSVWLRYTLLGLVIALVLIRALRPAPLTVEIATVTRGEFTQQVVEDGRTRPHDVYVVTAPIPGNLQRVSWLAGDRIKKGDEVAKIFPNISVLLDKRAEQEAKQHLQSLEASYERANILIEGADVAYKKAKADYQRNLALAKRGYVSKSDFDTQKLGMDLRKKEYESALFSAKSAKHEVEKAKASLSEMQSGLLRTDEHFVKVYAPIDGQVLKVEQQSEGPITAGAAILSIANIRNLEIIADILSTDAVQVKPGDTVLIQNWGGDTPLVGKVRLVEPGGFMKLSALGVEEQRVNVIIDITSPREHWESLGAEFRVEVAIIVFKAQGVLQLPVSALFRHNNKWAVFVVTKHKAHLREIEIGRRNAKNAMLISGLSDGDKVIVYPSEGITDGTRVAFH